MSLLTDLRWVLCEGKEDRLVMQALAEHAGLGGRLQFEDYRGRDRLRDELRNLKVRPEYTSGALRRLLVTRDANGDPAGAWTSVASAVAEVLRAQVTQPGEWVQIPDGPELTAWVVPGPGRAGMIETLCLQAGRERDATDFECLDGFVECLETRHRGPVHEKVRFAIWTIVSQGEGAKDRLSMDRAIRRLPMDWSSPIFDELRAQLRATAEG